MDRLTQRQRSLLMSRIRSKDTEPELLVRGLLYRMGYRYRLHVRRLPGTPDIVFQRRGKVVFVHGCFWHQHPNCSDAFMPSSRTEYWIPKLERNVQRDEENRQKLEELGWQALVIWECETTKLSKLRRRLQRFLAG
jgi:DNA mismatch endonuclease (patch repair protein)